MRLLLILFLLFSFYISAEETLTGDYEADVVNLKDELRSLRKSKDTNASGVSDNTTDIATNTANVATNAAAIAANTTLVETVGIHGWINFNGSGTIAINDSYNVTSINDDGVGLYTITWDTDFADANYAVVGTAYLVATKNPIVSIAAIAAGTVQIDINNFDGAAVDPTVISIIAIGNQ